MSGFFPPGFWAGVAVLGMAIFMVFGVDLLFGAKLMGFVSRVVNKRVNVDQLIVNALQDLKKTTDREFDFEESMMHGWGRFVMSGLLFFGAILLLVKVLPALP